MSPNKLIQEPNDVLNIVKEQKEAITILRAQIKVYCSDFLAERAAKEKIHEKKETTGIATDNFAEDKNISESGDRQSLIKRKSHHGTRASDPDQQAIPQEVKAGTRKTANLIRTAKTQQRPEELLTEFYERLCETFQVYTSFDPRV